MTAPLRREVAEYLDETSAFLKKERDDFAQLMSEGMELFMLDDRKLADELEILPFTIESWRKQHSIPLTTMQHIAIKKLRAHAPEYENHYNIVWSKYTDKRYETREKPIRYYAKRISYWHEHWLITNATDGCWSYSGDLCWGLWDSRNGLVLESVSPNLLFACAREKILEESAQSMSEFEFEVV
jgi:hypothetical protein